MTEELLDGADVVAVFEEVGGEGVAEGVAGGPLDDAGLAGGETNGALDGAFVEVLATAGAAPGVEAEVGGGEDELPVPDVGGGTELAGESLREVGMAEALLEVTLVLLEDLGKVVAEEAAQAGGEHGAAVAAPLGLADEELVVGEVDVADTQAEGFEEAEAGAVEEGGNEAMDAGELGEEGADLAPGEDDGKVARTAGTHDGVHVAEVAREEGAVEEEEGREGLILGGGGDLVLDGQVGEELVNLVGAEVGGMPPLVEEDEASHPGDVGLLGAAAEVPQAELVTQAIEEARGVGRGAHTPTDVKRPANLAPEGLVADSTDGGADMHGIWKVGLAVALTGAVPAAGATTIAAAEREATVAALVQKVGSGQEARIRQGVDQVADRWWASDGDGKAFQDFCLAHFEVDPAATFARFATVMEQVDGHLHELHRLLLEPQELDRGPVAPFDELLAEVNLQAHVDDDLFRSKAAFAVLLNFPVRTLAEVLTQSPGWDRQTWAATRMTDRLATRTPPEVLQRIATAFTAADNYIAGYYVRMDGLRTSDGRQLFADGLRLITHWNLRDELAAHYGKKDAGEKDAKAGLEKQRMIAKVMERIVRQEIPQAAIDGAGVLWDPVRNVATAKPGVVPTAATDLGAREPDTRYAKWLSVFQAVREADAFDPQAPTYVQRRFERDRQMPEAEVRALLEGVLGSPEAKALAGIIRQRLGRPLEPFDIWYSGFKSRGAHSEAELDALTKQRYPTVAAVQADLPRILRGLGFADEKADWLAARIVVDPSRGAGHAMGAVRREDKAHLRTHVGADGMDYKGYNIAVHELGHNVEQVFSLHANDQWWLAGVPNNAFTEALAFTFQERDLELLGLGNRDDETRRNETLAALWATYEIGGVSLVDMDVWNWLYAHPQATPAELRTATLEIARAVWNRWYAPVFGVKDSEILAIYSHMIVYGLYLPDYAIGHVIAFQVARQLHDTDFGKGFEQAARQGRLTPNAWMRGATGSPVSAAALLAAAKEAMAALPH